MRWGRRVKLTRWLRDVGVAGVRHLNTAAILKGKKERVAILKRSASGENWTLRHDRDISDVSSGWLCLFSLLTCTESTVVFILPGYSAT